MIFIRLNKYYLFISAVLFSFFLFVTSNRYILLYLLHTTVFISYLSVVNHFSKPGKSEIYYSSIRLLKTVFIYSSIIVLIYNFISYTYTNNFYVFSEADAVFYHHEALNMASKKFCEGIKYYLSFNSLEDLGAVLLSSILYRIVASKFILNAFYVIAGLLTADCIYRISLNFMSRKYAFSCGVAYSLSSFLLHYHSSGHKESILCMLIVLFFDRYYFFIKEKRIVHLCLAVLFLAMLILFRPVLIIFCLTAVLMSFILKKKKGTTGFVIIILFFSASIVFYPVFQPTYDRFLKGGDLDGMLSTKRDMIKVNVQFTYATNLLALLIGPLPTITPEESSEKLSFYSAGLIYKILLSFFFWIGIYHIFKQKHEMFYPLLFFAFFEMTALLLIIEGLELRNSMPHLFIIYIVAFWFMEKCNVNCLGNDEIAVNYNTNNILRLFNVYVAIAFFLIFFWNLRSQII